MVTGAQQGGTRFPCPQCERTFARKEHMIRHRISHTEETPYECPSCQQRFKRQDVYSRHVNLFCHGQQDGDWTGNSSGSKRRCIRACNRCHSQKLKCNGSSPCQRCTQRAETCVYSDSREAPLLRQNSTSGNAPSTDATTSRSYSNASHISPEQDGSLLGNEDVSHLNRVSSRTSTGTVPTALVDHMTTFSPQHPSHVPGLPMNMSSISYTPLHHTSAGIHHMGTEQGYTSEMPMELMQGDYWLSMFDNEANIGSWYNPNECSDPFLLSRQVNFALENDRTYIMNNIPAERFDPDMLRPQQFDVHLDPPPTGVSAPSRGTSPPVQQNPPAWIAKAAAPFQNHDPTIVSYLLEGFRANVVLDFPIFEGFQITPDTLADVILAMAAVGGLFCKVEGCFKIALAMYNDARRLVIGRPYSQAQEILTQDQELNVIQTYIALEIFGICSGDGRAFECSEVFHKQLLQLAKKYSLIDVSGGPSSSVASAKNQNRLLGSLYMLETYRVTLVQRAPDLYMSTSAQAQLAEVQPKPSSDFDSVRLGDLLRSFLSPHLPLPNIISPIDSRILLSTLTMLSWHVRTTSTSDQSFGPLWKKENIELALHRWWSHTKMGQDRYSADVTLSSGQETLLFHLVLLNMQVNMNLLHRCVRVHSFQQSVPESLRTELLQWGQSKECDIAQWHAKEIMELCKLHMTGPRHAEKTFQKTAGDTSLESPHTAICVYLATLVLWAARMARPGPDAEDAKKATTKAVRLDLESGVHVLGYLQVRIAEGLSDLLQALSVNPTQYELSNTSPP